MKLKEPLEAVRTVIVSPGLQPVHGQEFVMVDWNLWKRPFNSYIFLWMALGLLSLMILLVLGAWKSRERDRWVSHTIEILLQLERYEASILSAQVEMKTGSVWTAPRSGSEHVKSDVEAAQASVQRLFELTGDNPRQSVRVRVLRSLTEQLADHLQAQLKVPPLIKIPIDSSIGDLPLRETISEIRNEERALLEQRERARSAAENAFGILTAFSIAANLVIVWWAYAASRRYLMERNLTDFEVRALNTRLAEQVAAIRGLNASLESRVAEKTSLLAATVAKLQTTNQELERFAYVASHDMQEPLRQVVSFNNLLSVKYSDKLDANANRYLEYSVAGAKRLQLMLRGLLQYTTTSPAAVYRAEIPVELLIQSVFNELVAEIEDSGAKIQVNAAPGLCIVGDGDMLRTLTTALISNGIKFRQPGGQPSVDVSFERLPDRWSMVVADNGIGVEERFIPKMFEMFARFHPVGQHSGAGVGLALSKRIVDCHGGKVTVQPSTSGPGTTFTVQIPILSKDSQNTLETGQFPY